MTSLWRSAAAITALVVGALVTTSAPASAGAGETGCPVGWETLFVSDLLARGYSLEFVTFVDANVDGVMCGKPLNEVQEAKFCESVGGCSVDVIYVARDNDVAGR
jgi:hypothetical protein